MYVAGFVIPVPENKRDAFLDWARSSAALLRELGCLEIVESWEDNVPDGERTDFRKAVAALSGERIVFSWQIWPDKAACDAAEARLRDYPRFEPAGEAPFDSRRLILGGFTPLHVMGRD